MSQVVGLGVCAAPIEQANYKKPPMVVLIRDLASVSADAEEHDRQVEIDGDVVVMPCALDHVVAQELSVALERIATRIEKSDEYGTMPDEPREFAVFVPEQMREGRLWPAGPATLRLSMHPVYDEDTRLHVAVLAMDGEVLAMLGAESCRKLAAQISRKATQVRRTQG